MEIMPERINVMKVVTYDVETIIDNIITDGIPVDYEITIDDVMKRVEQYAEDDFACGWGHVANVKELIFQDENGNDL